MPDRLYWVAHLNHWVIARRPELADKINWFNITLHEGLIIIASRLVPLLPIEKGITSTHLRSIALLIRLMLTDDTITALLASDAHCPALAELFHLMLSEPTRQYRLTDFDATGRLEDADMLSHIEDTRVKPKSATRSEALLQIHIDDILALNPVLFHLEPSHIPCLRRVLLPKPSEARIKDWCRWLPLYAPSADIERLRRIYSHRI